MPQLFLAQNLYVLRKVHNLTQSEAATALHLNRSTYANYESVKEESGEPDLLKVLEIATFYDISIDRLLSEKLEIDSYRDEVAAKKRGENMTPKVTGNVTGNDQNLTAQRNNLFHKDDLTEAEKTTLWLLLKEMRQIRQDIDEIKVKVGS